MNEIEMTNLLQEANDIVPKLSYTEAIYIIRNKKTLIVDVREVGEVQATSLIENAINIPKSLFDQGVDVSNIHDHTDSDHKTYLLIYCAAGVRSAIVGHKLIKEDYINVFNIGGYAEWLTNKDLNS
ncbi:rhodanese-like domain-containing protein [Gammaproteobacteria bacterium]|nr:rhodanese-like domain-containing protein [Gammaproteobacteria bacterium]